jgi:hypothetical protein
LEVKFWVRRVKAKMEEKKRPRRKEAKNMNVKFRKAKPRSKFWGEGVG